MREKCFRLIFLKLVLFTYIFSATQLHSVRCLSAAIAKILECISHVMEQSQSKIIACARERHSSFQPNYFFRDECDVVILTLNDTTQNMQFHLILLAATINLK